MLALGLLALSFGAAIRTEIDATRNLVDQKRAHYLARAGIDYAVYRIIESQMAFAKSQQRMDLGPGSIPEVMTGAVTLQLGADFADVQVVDETGKINLNTAPSHLIYNLLITVGMEPGDADMLTDSIEDWRDPDEFFRPNGAESDYYLSLPQPYFAKNGPFDVPEELLLVRGVTPEIYYGRKGLTPDGERVEYFGLGKYLTVFSSVNRINVNSAPVPVLAAIPGLTYETALRHRRNAPPVPPGRREHRIDPDPRPAHGHGLLPVHAALQRLQPDQHRSPVRIGRDRPHQRRDPDRSRNQAVCCPVLE